MKLILIFALAITQQKQIIGLIYETEKCLFGGLLCLFASIGSVAAQEVSDYSKLQPRRLFQHYTPPPLDHSFRERKNSSDL